MDSSIFLTSAGAAAVSAASAAIPSPRARDMCTAERVMLSSITIVVTVAPLTMSTDGSVAFSGGSWIGDFPT